MRQQHTIEVGIMHGDLIEFSLSGRYTCDGIPCEGDYSFGSDLSHEMIFTPTNPECFFTLKGVTIGVDFHWQRKENQSFRGSLKLMVRDGELYAVDIVGIEDYLTSVISSEMSASASPELLKAHAVISRSWVLRQIQRKNENSVIDGMIDTPEELIRWQESEDHQWFDVCADDHCQRYQGITKAFTSSVREAIEATWGEVLVYDGQVCDARFSKCCGGVTEEFGTCWGDKQVPYLASVSCPFCNTSDKSILKQILPSFDLETVHFHDWEVIYDTGEISALVAQRTGIDYGIITDIRPLERGVSGRIYRLEIIGTKQRRIIGKELEIRKSLSPSHLYSSAFDVEKTSSGFILRGKGWGHGVGLCQIGAAVMGNIGCSYSEILHHYYKDVKIEKLYE